MTDKSLERVDGVCLLSVFFQAENLKENVFYEFQVRAMNMAGLSKGSVPSAVLECKEWTITLPGMQEHSSTFGKKGSLYRDPLNINHTLL